MIFRHLLSLKSISVEPLYAAIVAAARQPRFYQEMAVPDTVDGRFDMIVLHMYIVLDRLKGSNEDLRQALTDRFFADMDSNLREMGVGDLSVAKKVRKMAEAYFGRMAAYTDAISKGETQLNEAIARNVFAGATETTIAVSLGRWLVTAVKLLEQQSTTEIESGKLVFP